jgi:hypothetical protein
VKTKRLRLPIRQRHGQWMRTIDAAKVMGYTPDGEPIFVALDERWEPAGSAISPEEWSRFAARVARARKLAAVGAVAIVAAVIVAIRWGRR